MLAHMCVYVFVYKLLLISMEFLYIGGGLPAIEAAAFSAKHRKFNATTLTGHVALER